jgi:hypothetical protein
MYACMFIYVYMYICIYLCMYVCIYVYIGAYTSGGVLSFAKSSLRPHILVAVLVYEAISSTSICSLKLIR